MRRRIYGLEQEYGVAGADPDIHPCVADRMVRPLARRNRTSSLDLSTFLDNGGRVYVDTGQHPEYATPECDSLIELLRYERAGDVIMDQLRQEAETGLAEESGHPVHLTILKNNLDAFGTTYGWHENYLLPRAVHMQFCTAVLVPFLVSRQIWAGAGALISPDGDTTTGDHFVLSQRAGVTENVVGTCTTQQRPIVNARDEPHAEARKYRRLHLVLGDATMGDVPTFLKVAVTSMILDVIEAAGVLHSAEDLIHVPAWWPALNVSWPLETVALVDPIAALHSISRDLTCRQTVSVSGGERLSPLDLQWFYVELVDNHFRHNAPTHEQGVAFELWVHVLELLESDPMRARHLVDWVAKLWLLDKLGSRHGFNLDSTQARLVDLRFHDIAPEGIHRSMVRRGFVQRLTTDADVQSCVQHPPQSTRARLRSEVIRLARARNARIVADWSMCKVARLGEEWQTIALSDPFAPTDPAGIAAAMPAALDIEQIPA